jgi:spermidine synthase
MYAFVPVGGFRRPLVNVGKLSLYRGLIMELWLTENQTDNVRFSIKVNKQLFSERSEYQEVEIFEADDFGKILVIDGLIMVTEKDEFIYHEMIAHVPMACNPNIRRVLVIGGGDGGTVRELLKYESVDRIDLVEIDQMVVDACSMHLKSTSQALHHKKVNMYFIDGIEFVKHKNNIYDLIIVDSTDPFGPGEGLFTNEFYSNCYNALTNDGILINQSESPFYKKLSDAFVNAYHRIESVFENAYVYQFHMPTYPSGHWLFGFSSKKIHPVGGLNEEYWNSLGIETRYYDTKVHAGSFMLPRYVKKLIK